MSSAGTAGAPREKVSPSTSSIRLEVISFFRKPAKKDFGIKEWFEYLPRLQTVAIAQW